MSHHRPLGRPAVLADLDDLPPTWRGEILHERLYVSPRPRFPEGRVRGSILVDVFGPFGGSPEYGPGGWWILVEPGIRDLPGVMEFRAIPAS